MAAGEKEARLTGRPTFPGLDIWLQRPLGFVGEERIEERHGLTDPAAVRERELPEVVLLGREHLAKQHHVIQLEDRVAVRLGAPQLQREASIDGHLLTDKDILILLATGGELLLVADEIGVDRELQIKGYRVVVLGRGLFLAVLAGDHPFGEIAEPTAQVLRHTGREGRGTLERLHGGGHLDQVQRVDDADATARRDARNGLREVEIWIHAQLVVQKEYAEQLGRLDDILVVTGDLISRRKRRHGIPQGLHDQAMLAEVLRIGLPVASDVRDTVGLAGVGPPIVAVGVEVVDSTLAELGRERGEADRRLRQGLLGGLEDALTIDRGDVDDDFGRDGRTGGGRSLGRRSGLSLGLRLRLSVGLLGLGLGAIGLRSGHGHRLVLDVQELGAATFG